ncbi:MAG: RNA methyltransferase [Saprospirales bacterium]|nr:MAG: RNA methyltransferase [Saprospirales bacterium]
MLSRQKITLINSLNRKKNRTENGLYVIEGIKLVSTAIQYSKEAIISIYALAELIEELPCESLPVTIVDAVRLKKISNLKTPQGVLALMRIKENCIDKVSGSLGLNIFLDGVQDPGNVGTLIRTADWYGVANLILGEGCADLYHPKVIQAAMGSHFGCNVINLPIQSAVENLKPSVIIGTEEGGDAFERVVRPGALVCLGSEGKGLSEEVRSFCEVFSGIDGDSGKVAESLNVSMVGAILMDRYFGK